MTFKITFRDNLRRNNQILQILEFLNERKKSTFKELMDQGFGIPQSTLYGYLKKWEKDNLILIDRINQEKKNYSHLNYSRTDNLSEFLFFSKQVHREGLKKVYKNSLEKDSNLEKMRDVADLFRYSIIPNVFAHIKEVFDKLNSQKNKNTDFFKSLEEYTYNAVESMIKDPFIKSLVSDSSQRWKVREQT